VPRASAARRGAAVLAVALAWRIVLAIWLVPAWESAVNCAPLPDWILSTVARLKSLVKIRRPSDFRLNSFIPTCFSHRLS
jgi:hypothetical protein